MRTTSMVIALLLLGVAAAAATPTYEPRQAFSESDTNSDGRVDRDEFRVRTIDVFYAADANKDTFLSVEECAVLPGGGDDLRRADTDGDGRIDLDEFLRVREIDYEAVDRDDDGTLSVTEVIEAWEPRK